MTNSTAINYLLDLGHLVKESALKAKISASSEDHFDLGYLAAYYEIVSLMQAQAEVFGIPLQEIALWDINPDRDLL
ncbi:hypothetical protein [Adhaeretor mobilis]|uniref:Uncharacterized protein n=1 Tax=Adhaeretor mobilis TaxID=1930276 RepID=A0A517MZ86_9BACT|nr:hypothetical protein [Adhaeretor mobilis]QDT00190.1 hypothetical protein HG15A2_35250 [Adhaeretor mobilis]